MATLAAVTSFKMAPPLTTEQKTRNCVMVPAYKFYCHSPAPFQKPVQVQGSTSKEYVEDAGGAVSHKSKKRGGSKSRVRTPNTVGTIRASVASSQTRNSVRQLAAENEVSPSTAWLILRNDLRLYPHRIHIFLSLKTVWREKRTGFEEELGYHLQQNPLGLSEGQSVQQCYPNSAWTVRRGSRKVVLRSQEECSHLWCTELCITSWRGSRDSKGSHRACHPHVKFKSLFVVLTTCSHKQIPYRQRTVKLKVVVIDSNTLYVQPLSIFRWKRVHINKFPTHINKFPIANALLSWKW